ncbi:tRNA (adenosine(37)-N6)-dimethylallyltransferase MiaA [Olsenella sp. HMSC062G07]|uniref:tRNA (adenosine(37)-N6)-dimethylallyltransferase MiaA n=1 Tax=Olsenella sp. HMSC062G07 TaxID=1739330 RepID=UPI0008A2AB87|nr:tRNA (adenosine(37)-N6)-dimethylallyltransferase MiaA [Olsenella sp. HMSC062G07]OFK24664.1 tRNA dimethylallyltransferase [Olsenella sp. HMSC062G07]
MSLPGPVIAIVGPTASGKSAVAERVAERLESAVISVDAMQVYCGMDVGTAKTPVGARRAPLLMVDVADPRESFSARLFQDQARAHIDRLLARQLTPVLCGGTGLYLDAVIDEMDFPPGPEGLADGVRERLDEQLRALGPTGLHARLAELDPQSARLIHPQNSRRVMRALELWERGLSYARTHEGLKDRRPRYHTLIFALMMDRQRLYRRIERRVDQMLEAGLLDEVRGLWEEGALIDDTTAAQAIGYKELVSVLRGEATLDDARRLMVTRTRRYAKRQLSWIRRDGRARTLNLDLMTPEEAAEKVLDALAEAREVGAADG